ncbi:MAG TPA: hypothetical protein VMI47_12915 [Pseudolabrys sp.]|nr:hypothetical protein [Pseudolabrys sp.]
MFGTMNAWLEAVRFVNDSQRVIALRLIRLASGGTLAADETRRMVAEKMFALGEAQVAVATAWASGRAARVGRNASAPFRRRVRANRRRLGA